MFFLCLVIFIPLEIIMQVVLILLEYVNNKIFKLMIVFVCLFFFNDNLKDNQPPEVRGCSEDIDIKSSEDITFFNWTAPSFYDPAGKPITVTTNYPTNNFNFSWGDFKVQYVALKPSNGLRKECVFNLKIRRKFIHSQNIRAKLPLYCNRRLCVL